MRDSSSARPYRPRLSLRGDRICRRSICRLSGGARRPLRGPDAARQRSECRRRAVLRTIRALSAQRGDAASDRPAGQPTIAARNEILRSSHTGCTAHRRVGSDVLMPCGRCTRGDTVALSGVRSVHHRPTHLCVVAFASGPPPAPSPPHAVRVVSADRALHPATIATPPAIAPAENRCMLSGSRADEFHHRTRSRHLRRHHRGAGRHSRCMPRR